MSFLRKPVGSNHALALLVVCFAASGGLRMLSAGAALAESSGHVEDTQKEHAEMDTGPTESADVLLRAVQERSAQLDVQERRISERMALLKIAEEEFEIRRKELIEAEEKLSATLAIADNAAEKDLLRLTAVYENMKAKKAAELFDSMDTVFAAGFLIRMAPQSAADVLSAMDKDAAYSASVLMASRNVGAPTK